jgi:hypothetical protein
MTAYTVWAPVGWLAAVAFSVTQFCQPPVAAIGNWASSGPVADPVRSSTVPEPTAEETRAETGRAPAAPRSTPSYRIQSPLPR